MSAYVFAGGGTGGHVFPGIAVLEELREREPDAAAIFLVSTRPVDANILNARGLPFEAVPAAPLILRPAGLVRFAWRWGGAVRASRDALRRIRSDHGTVRILSTGGFVSAPVAQAARVERVPLVLLNQDDPPGKANRWIARHAARVLSSAPTDHPGWERIGPVVRREARAPGDAPHCRGLLGIDASRPTLLITGASQGARSVNEFAEAFVREHGYVLADRGWQVIHQTGAEDSARWESAYADAGVPALVSPFFDAMGACWGSADFAVSRAGAGSVAEAWANAVPSLFMPYPHHRDQHQRRNAEPLEHAGAATIERDRVDPALNLDSIGPRLLGLLSDAPARERMRAGYDALGPVDGAARLADELTRLDAGRA